MIAINIISKILGFSFSDSVTNIQIDSRLCDSNSIFFAIKGERTDGRLYARDVLNMGGYVVCENPGFDHERLILVADIKQSIIEIAMNIRSELQRKGVVIYGITGSVGKTFTKRALAACLDDVLVSEGNLNTEYGLFLTLCKAKTQHKYVVLELGIGKPGDMDILGHIAMPDRAIVTNVTMAHLQFFENRQHLIAEKLRLLDYTRDFAVVNVDTDHPKARPLIADIVPHEYPNTSGTITIDGITHEIMCPNLYGKHLLWNMACVIQLLGRYVPAMCDLTQTPGRGVMHRNLMHNGIKFDLYDSSYNANPSSMEAEFNVVRACGKHTIGILGQMGELGPDSAYHHNDVYGKAKACMNEIILVGPAWGKDTCDLPLAKDKLYNSLEEGCLVFVKGSNSNGLQAFVREIMNA